MTRLENLLVIFSEECNETAKEVTKALRFGLDNKEPNQELTNREKIFAEWNDLVAVMEVLIDENVFEYLTDRELITRKKIKMAKYLQYSIEKQKVVR